MNLAAEKICRRIVRIDSNRGVEIFQCAVEIILREKFHRALVQGCCIDRLLVARPQVARQLCKHDLAYLQ